MFREAEFSQDMRYRYALTRRWNPAVDAPLLTWVMFNPSTADRMRDDPTIRRCIDFSVRWRWGGLIILNLFAYRSPRPVDLCGVDDPVGPSNDDFLRFYMKARKVVVAWGRCCPAIMKPQAQARSKFVVDMAQSLGIKLFCLGTNRDGSPKHPLYVHGATLLQDFRQ